MSPKNPTVSEIGKKLQLILDEHPKEGQGLSSKDFTKKIKATIGKIGKEKGYEVFASGDNEFGFEWLFDLTWCCSNDRGFNSLELALESEQSTNLGQIKLDFDKLLVTNARVKIMICMTRSLKAGFDGIIDQCNKAINNYDLLSIGTTIHLFIWDDHDSGKIIYREIVKTTPASFGT